VKAFDAADGRPWPTLRAPLSGRQAAL